MEDDHELREGTVIRNIKRIYRTFPSYFNLRKIMLWITGLTFFISLILFSNSGSLRGFFFEVKPNVHDEKYSQSPKFHEEKRSQSPKFLEETYSQLPTFHGEKYSQSTTFHDEKYSISPKTFMAYICLDKDNSTCCGGTQIHRRVVLTAAHCVESSYNISLALGVWNISTAQDSTIILTGENIIVHPNYSRNTLENDIALITLPTTVVTENSAVVAIGDCIYLAAFCLSENRNAEVMGWQLATSDILLVENVKLIKCFEEDTFCDCSATPPKVCSVGNSKPCDGWSGGPLLWNKMQIGIISGGEKVCSQSSVAKYTNLVHYLPWIKEHIRELAEMEENDFNGVEAHDEYDDKTYDFGLIVFEDI